MGHEIGFLLGTMLDPTMIIGTLLMSIFIKDYSKVMVLVIMYALVVELLVYSVRIKLGPYDTIATSRVIGSIIEANIFFGLKSIFKSIFFGLKSIFKKKDKTINE